ncbi:Cupin 2, conserved barrel domain protein [Candidatus Sulfopaludibacter sp. SbA3]|nr:Cupin 2, conserved barrel domain protein [Candidatus Sulfopaludibacter sp. SbA3]
MPLYDWNEVEKEQMNPLVSRQVIHTDGLTIARIHLQQNAVVASHSHMNEQVTMIQQGALKFFIDGGEKIVRAGETLTIPPHVPHGVEAVEDTIAVDVFSPRREDWIRGDDAYMRR